ncbi:MAG TPA: TRAP transporter substrate-binding protein DctP [Polyangia bacterium]|nr:TRAP transporter substrate-binding protein DctP [Polyangia bacterium]
MKRAIALACSLAAALTAARAPADGHFVVRMATVAPDGTAYARELRAFSREVADATQGEVSMKWYWGGIAGDDRQVAERVKRGQLDGVASGMICQLVAPSFRALHMPGLFRTRDEVRYATGQLWSELAHEFHGAGYELLGFALLGPVEVFSRHPVRTLDDLKREKMWVWDTDVMLRDPLRAMGLDLVALPIEDAGRAYSDGKTDGFLTIPSGTLAFQWYAQAHYVTELRINYLTGCIAMTSRAFDRLPTAHQQSIRGAAAKFAARLEQVNEEQDRQLLGGLFTRQGITPVPVSEAFRAEFAQAARAALEKGGEQLVPSALRKRVEALIAEYRAAHKP